MNINYLSVREETPAQGYWDQTFLGDLLAQLPEGDRSVFVIPGAYQGKPEYYDRINEELAKHKKVMVFVTSDEEGNFDCSELIHTDMIVYSQYGTSDRIFPLGYTPKTREVLKQIGPVKKDIPYFFSGQITHPIRQQMAEVFEVGEGVFLPTDGFAKGIRQQPYLMLMALSKVALAPPGPISHDSFRLYEALEAGCIPIVSKVAPGGRYGYWEKLFGNFPFPQVEKYYRHTAEGWTQNYANQIYAWWISYKQQLKKQLAEGLGCQQDPITVFIPTSPIPSHPSTEIIEQTIRSVRHHLPNAEIIIGIDGVRKEQEEMRPQYEEYTRQLLWLCNFEYENITPVFFTEHKHQSGMMKEILPNIETPLMLFIEHDTPLVTDTPIDWEEIKGVLAGDIYSVVRFHYESFIPEEHKHLMMGREGNFMKTIQYSARPNLACTHFYEEILDRMSDSTNSFIEDFAYGQVVEAPWEEWRVAIYHPGDYIKRSINLDGRAGGQKFDDQQIF